MWNRQKVMVLIAVVGIVFLLGAGPSRFFGEDEFYERCRRPQRRQAALLHAAGDEHNFRLHR